MEANVLKIQLRRLNSLIDKPLLSNKDMIRSLLVESGLLTQEVNRIIYDLVKEMRQ